nr:unnamed protein product [Callosobruchus analis]
MDLGADSYVLAALGVLVCGYAAYLAKERARRFERDRRRTGNYSYYLKMKHWDTDQFFKYTRMTTPVFEKLLSKITPKIQHQFRSGGIFPEERLVITLQYLSQGTSMQALAWTFHTKIPQYITLSMELVKLCGMSWLWNTLKLQKSGRKFLEDFRRGGTFLTALGALMGSMLVYRLHLEVDHCSIITRSTPA